MNPLVQAPLIVLGLVIGVILILTLMLVVNIIICWIDSKVGFDFESWSKNILLLIAIFLFATFIVYVGLTK